MYVYVVEAQNGLVKIGCSRVPESRAALISAHSPVLARLIAKWPGSQAEERELHARFSEYRHHNEWFSLVGPVAAFAAEVRGKDVEIPGWDCLMSLAEHERKLQRSERASRRARERWANPEWRSKWMLDRKFQRIWRDFLKEAQAERRKVSQEDFHRVQEQVYGPPKVEHLSSQKREAA
ncbi:GIY-YIG nuclease family protein [Microvirga zambiensis]|uniref:GIY-YIG nuclease family protein n=1 Tax=Microvirga zambiensis TaxID=1402137 RepID=UPI001AEFABA3|nr:GIY-YIG nuclease family protein [Microvirga zambiensis]